MSVVLIAGADVLLYGMRRTRYDKLLDQEQGVLDLGGEEKGREHMKTVSMKSQLRDRGLSILRELMDLLPCCIKKRKLRSPPYNSNDLSMVDIELGSMSNSRDGQNDDTVFKTGTNTLFDHFKSFHQLRCPQYVWTLMKMDNAPHTARCHLYACT